ncbi:MAG: hypothetical protein ABSE49_35510 [Polyangiaceae bacterium]|jgi:hypothetical protein
MSDDDKRLAEAERALCAYYDATLSEHQRGELRVLYAIAAVLDEHRALAADDLRRSLERCGGRLGKNRTTLLRYSFVHRRIAPSEFSELIGLSNARGYPATFWDLVDAAKLRRPDRRAYIEERLGLGTRPSLAQDGRQPSGGSEDDGP